MMVNLVGATNNHEHDEIKEDACEEYDEQYDNNYDEKGCSGNNCASDDDGEEMTTRE